MVLKEIFGDFFLVCILCFYGFIVIFFVFLLRIGGCNIESNIFVLVIVNFYVKMMNC